MNLGLTHFLGSLSFLPQERPTPDVRDEHYGPHERQVLDLWRAKSDAPTPLVVFIHSGGFLVGSKDYAKAGLLQGCLASGISFAAINYRYSSQAPFPAPFRDAARAVQHLRSSGGATGPPPTRSQLHITRCATAAQWGSRQGSSEMQQERPILLIEDDPDAADLLGLALKKAGLRRPLRVLADGDEAIAYLSGAPPFENRKENPPPCLLLLDVKLPRKSGLEVLTWLRSRFNTRPLPVVMLTSSMASKDIEEALRLGIRAYCIKPSDFNDLKKLARMIRSRVESKEADSAEIGPAEGPESPPQKRPSSSLPTAP